MSTTQNFSNSVIAELRSYTPPALHTGKDWYVDFYAFCPVSGKMKRKKIKLNHIKTARERRQYANGLIKRIFFKLESGWNPFIMSDHPKAYKTFKDACVHYRKFLYKMLSDGVYRNDTVTSYISYLQNIEKWNNDNKIPITYIYQFNRDFVNDFLEHIHVDRDNTPITRNNYLSFIYSFSSFLVEKRYLDKKPCEGIDFISSKKIKKQRTIIPDNVMCNIYNLLCNKNKHYLLACYILHYCFIRPKEMSLIKINDISLKNKTITVPFENAKNRKTGVISLPVKVIHLMLELNIFDCPGNYYLFSDRFAPGRDYKSEKSFRDYWSRYIRKDLKLPDTYKFYSLKDTGITSMLRKYDVLTVRDQARHSSILMTDIYTPHDIQQANELIVNHIGIF